MKKLILMSALLCLPQILMAQNSCVNTLRDQRYQATEVSGNQVTEAENRFGSAQYRNLKLKSARLLIRKDSSKNQSYVVINADLKKNDEVNGLNFLIIGVEIPNRLLPFKNGTNYRASTHDMTTIFADGPLVNGYISVKVNGDLAQITQVEASDMGYGISMGDKESATHKVRTSHILITLNAKGEPQAVSASSIITFGNSKGESMTGPQDGNSLELRF